MQSLMMWRDYYIELVRVHRYMTATISNGQPNYEYLSASGKHQGSRTLQFISEIL